MPFIDIDFTPEQEKTINKKAKIAAKGMMVLTDASPETVREALEFVTRPNVPLSAEDLVIRAIEGRLLGNAIIW